MGSGSIWAGIWDDGDGAIRIGAGAGDDMFAGRGAGELCLVGENDGRLAELGGKEECGLLKLKLGGRPLAGRGEAAGECFTGEPPGPAADAGRLKLRAYGGAAGCGGPKGLESNGFGPPNELLFCCGCGMWKLLVGLLGIRSRL
jgi:hypothetical protein